MLKPRPYCSSVYAMMKKLQNCEFSALNLS